MKARGSVKVSFRDESRVPREAVLKNVLYIPSFPYTIFSVESATRKGAQVGFQGNFGTLQAEDGTNFSVNAKNGLYYLNLQQPQHQNSQHLSTMHARLGVLSIGDILKGTKSYADVLRSSLAGY